MTGSQKRYIILIERVKNIIFPVESKEALFCKMDAKLIVQVIINIVDNAIKYTPKNSHIVIRTEKGGKQAIVSISDDGNGIADEIKPRIFGYVL